jgi:hypothetical protein
MYNLDDTYSQKFFSRRKSLLWRRDIIVPVIMKVFNPKSCIDFGCGNADILSGMLQKGVDVYGIEGSKNCKGAMYIPENSLFIHDLRLPLNLNRSFDLAMCVEVAEHLEQEYAAVLVSTVTTHSDTIFFTASAPGQAGVKHVNCQEKSYWIYLFSIHKYSIAHEKEDEVKKRLYHAKNKKGMCAYYYNLMVFEKDK